MSHPVVVDSRIFQLRPDFVVSIVRARGLRNGPSDASSTGLLRLAEESARRALDGSDPATQVHVAAWRDAYRAFGAKPNRTPCSAEALLSRAVEGDGIPAINRLVDVYNAVSVQFMLPVGGEDLARIAGTARLTIATGTEPFDTMRSGEPIVERPTAGEVVWLDDEGVTCRRWNWRQCVRTRLTERSTEAFFVLERLEPFALSTLGEATKALVDAVCTISPGAAVESWTLPNTESRKIHSS